MGLFSKTIPERKWTDVFATLHKCMEASRSRWFQDFTKHVNVGIRELTQQLADKLALLQFCAAATTVRENGYVKLKDFEFFTDLICIGITSKKMAELDDKLMFDLLAANDPKLAAQKWAWATLPIIAGTQHDQKLADKLSQWAAFLAVKTKIETCEACFDPKGAEAIRVLVRT